MQLNVKSEILYEIQIIGDAKNFPIVTISIFKFTTNIFNYIKNYETNFS